MPRPSWSTVRHSLKAADSAYQFREINVPWGLTNHLFASHGVQHLPAADESLLY